MKISLGAGARIGYLSAAPRVSTRDDAEAAGPRSHVLGMIQAMEATGATVERFIVGDRMPKVVRTGSESALARSQARNLAADLARLALGAINQRRAVAELGDRVDWVYERLAAMQSLGGPFARRGIPWILETSSLAYHEAKHERRALVLERLAKRRELAAYHRADIVVAVSAELRDLLIEVGVPARKIIVLPNGVDTVMFDPARYAGAPRLFPAFTIGFVGAVIAWQGLDLLLAAMAAMSDAEVSLAIAGDGPDRPRLETLVTTLGLDHRVRFVGRLRGSDVPRFLAGVDVGFSGQRPLLRGRMYHSPLKLYEYLAMGKPAIASAFDDARSVIADGQTGFLFEADDRSGLEASLARALAHRSELPGLAQQVRAEIVAHHSWGARLQDLAAAVAAL